MIDYFASVEDPAEAALRRIKGNYRRAFVARAIDQDGLGSIPEAWLDHSLSEALKNMLGSQHPQACGGEDLPDLEVGEVEIARLSLVDSVHGEVTSLRARREEDGSISYRMVDEYETEFELPIQSSLAPLSAEEALAMFADADPSPTDTECEVMFQSAFYPDLNGPIERGNE